MRLIPALLLIAACSNDPSVGDGDSGVTDAALDITRRDTGPITPSTCESDELDEVFVLTTDLDDADYESHLLRFDPESLEYVHIGEVVCPLDGALLRSMAVDRSGNGYATDNRGNLFRVNTSDASCAATGMETEQEGVRNFGMGYATLGDTNSERLYITAAGSWYRDDTTPYRRHPTLLHCSVLVLVSEGERSF